MIKTVIAKGDLEYLNKLFNTYSLVNDEKEMIKIGGKLVQQSHKLTKETLIEVFDRVYGIISKQRTVYRGLIDMEMTESKIGNKRKVKYLKEYRDILAISICENLKKFIKDIKKGINNLIDDNVNINFITSKLERSKHLFTFEFG
jgi:hypothetical protein